MNLNDLQLLKQHSASQAQSSRRSEKSDHLYQEGVEAFEQAVKTGFKDRSHVLKACELLIQALKTNRSDVRPCLMLSYLFFVLEDFDTALDYLKPVLEKAPQHTQALSLRERIQEALTQPGPSKASESELIELRGWIQQAVHHQLGQRMPQSVFSETELAVLQQQHQTLAQQNTRFLAQIQALEARFEVQALYQHLQPLEQKLTRLSQVIARSKSILQLLDTLQQEIQNTREAVQELSMLSASADAASADFADIDRWDDFYETALDRSEAYAEQVEELTAGHAQETLLEQRYQHFCDSVEHLADILDEQA